MKKRGVNQIVATVLLILLVLLMIAIVWLFLRKQVRGGSEELVEADDCLSIRLEPIECNYYTISPGVPTPNFCGDTIMSVKLRRIGDGDLRGVKFLLTSPNGSQYLGDALTSSPSIIASGEIANYGLFSSGRGEPAAIEVAAVIGSKGKTCGIITPSVPCTPARDIIANTCPDCSIENNAPPLLNVLDYGCFGNAMASNFIPSPGSGFFNPDINRDGLLNLNDYWAFCVSIAVNDCSGCAALGGNYTTRPYQPNGKCDMR